MSILAIKDFKFSYIILCFLFSVLSLNYAHAGRVKNEVAVYAGLDKITGKTTIFRVKINETYQFGALSVSPRVCYTSIGDESRGPVAFTEISELSKKRPEKTIFKGWMFASSPALNCLDHPIYDVWLTSCESPDLPPDTHNVDLDKNIASPKIDETQTNLDEKSTSSDEIDDSLENSQDSEISPADETDNSDSIEQ